MQWDVRSTCDYVWQQGKKWSLEYACWIVSIEHLILEGFPVPDEKKYEFQNELFSDDTFEPGELKVY